MCRSRRQWWLATIVVVVLAVSVVMARSTIATRLLDWSLALVDIHLVQLDGLHLESDHIAFERMVLRIGDQSRHSSVRGFKLRFRLFGHEPESLAIGAVDLVLPDRDTTRPSAVLPTLSVGRAIAGLHAIPPPTVTIDQLMVNGLGPLALRRDHGLWRLFYRGRELGLRLEPDGSHELGLSGWLREGPVELASLSGVFNAAADEHIEVTLDGALMPGAMAGTLAGQSVPFGVGDSPARLDWQLQGSLPDNLSLWERQTEPMRWLVHGSIGRAQVAGLLLQGARLRASGNVSWQRNRLTVELVEGAELGIRRIDGPPLSLQDSVLYLGRGASIQREDSRTSFNFANVTVDLPRLTAGDLAAGGRFALYLEGGFGSAEPLDGGQLQLDGRLLSQSLRLEHSAYWLPQLAVESRFSLWADQLRVDGQLNTPSQRRLLSFDAEHQLVTRRGTARIDTGVIRFSGDRASIRQWFPTWPYPFDLRHGVAEAGVKLRWLPYRDQFLVRGDFRQQLADMGGYFEEIGFAGLAGELFGSFELPRQLLIDKGSELRLDTLDVGLPINDIRLRLGAAIRPLAGAGEPRHKLHLQSFDARVFDGQVHAGEHLLQYHRPPGHLTLQVGELSLGSLVDTVGLDALSASGRLSGRLPLRFDGEGVTMRSGRLQALPPGGVLRYQGQLTAEGTQRASASPMAIVQQALGNYHYDTLAATANYAANGDLLLQFGLHGANPEMNDGQRIKLNLSVENNVPALLRSLRAGRTIEQWVESRYGQSR